MIKHDTTLRFIFSSTLSQLLNKIKSGEGTGGQAHRGLIWNTAEIWESCETELGGGACSECRVGDPERGTERDDGRLVR